MSLSAPFENAPVPAASEQPYVPAVAPTAGGGVLLCRDRPVLWAFPADAPAGVETLLQPRLVA
jgi:hypothetical protein